MVNLTREEVEILVLKDQEGDSYSGIAKRLGMSKSSVRQKYQNAKRKEKLANLPDDPNLIDFGSYSAIHLKTTTYIALLKAGVKNYNDFLNLSEIDILQMHGIGVSKLTELIEFRALLMKKLK